MRTPLTLLLLVALPAVALVGCITVREVDAEALAAEPAGGVAAGGAAGGNGSIRFCLDLARLEAAVEAGAPSTAAESAQELLARAPEDLRTDARRLAERLRGAPAAHDPAIDDPEVRQLTTRLRDAADDRCDPGDG